MSLTLVLKDLAKGCVAGEGLTVYVWQCDRDGRCSLYTVTGQNYLRGVQTADSGGRVTFDSIYPGCYPGRQPHLHFEVFHSLADAVSGARPRLISQIAPPQRACEEVYRSGSGGRGAADRPPPGRPAAPVVPVA